MKDMNNKCVFTLPSPTYAMKAKRILERGGIPSEVIKLSPDRVKKGCRNGVGIPCADVKRAGAILSENGINYSDVYGY